jgi:hypothetical protein
MQNLAPPLIALKAIRSSIILCLEGITRIRNRGPA